MYIVIELQTNGGTTSNFVFAFSEIAEAYAKYFSILSAAATSNVEIHTALLITDKGDVARAEHFEHPQGSEE